MRVKKSLESQNYFWPIKHSATAISDGAMLMAGATAETDLGVLIVAASSGPDCIGTLNGAIATTDDNTDVTDGDPWLVKSVTPVWPGIIVECDYDLTDTAAVASYSAPTVTITSLEDNIDTSWLYLAGGTGAGQLGFIDTSASGSCTVNTNFTTAPDNTTTVVKILRLFHQLAKLNTAADKIGTDAAAGTWTIIVLQNWITNVSRQAQYLRPDSGYHENLQNLNATGLGTRFYADIGVRNAGAMTLE